MNSTGGLSHANCIARTVDKKAALRSKSPMIQAGTWGRDSAWGVRTRVLKGLPLAIGDGDSRFFDRVSSSFTGNENPTLQRRKTVPFVFVLYHVDLCQNRGQPMYSHLNYFVLKTKSLCFLSLWALHLFHGVSVSYQCLGVLRLGRMACFEQCIDAVQCLLVPHFGSYH